MSIKQIIKILGVILALLAVGFSIMFIKGDEPQECTGLRLKVEKSDIVDLVNEEEIKSIIINQGLNPVGKKSSDIRLDKIRQAVESNSCVEQAKCYLSKSGKMVVEVKQREPVFRIVNTDTYFVDRKGVTVKYSTPMPIYLPLVSGHFSKKLLNEGLIDLVDYISNDKFLSSITQQIYVDSNEQIEIIPTIGSQRILLGKLEKDENEYIFPRQLSRLKQFYDSKVLDRLDWQKYSTIDLRFNKQVVLKK